MAVVINAKGTSAPSFRFGKFGNHIGSDGSEGLFASTTGNIANLATIKVATPVDADDASSQQFVIDQIALTANIISQLNTSITITDSGIDGAMSFVVDGGTVLTINTAKIDISGSTQLSAIDGTAAVPAYSFETDLNAGLYYNPLGGPSTENEVAIASDAKTIQKWRKKNGAVGNNHLVSEAGDGLIGMIAEGTFTNIDIVMTPKGTGVIKAPAGYDMSSAVTTAFATKAYVDNVLLQTQTKIASYTTTLTDDVIFADSTAGVLTITLGSAAAVNGKQQIIKDAGGAAGTNTITVATLGTETIDGQSTQPISNNFGSITVISNGTDWFLV